MKNKQNLRFLLFYISLILALFWLSSSPTLANPIHPFAISINHNGDLLAIGMSNGDIQIRDFGINRLLDLLVGHSNAVIDLAWTPNDAYLASGSTDGSLRTWNISTGQIFSLYLIIARVW